MVQDTIQTFYDITHREVETLELKTSAKDREMELMEDNHRQGGTGICNTFHRRAQ